MIISDENILQIFERQFYGPVSENGVLRVSSNMQSPLGIVSSLESREGKGLEKGDFKM
jgi:hypothetical protein